MPWGCCGTPSTYPGPWEVLQHAMGVAVVRPAQHRVWALGGGHIAAWRRWIVVGMMWILADRHRHTLGMRTHTHTHTSMNAKP